MDRKIAMHRPIRQRSGRHASLQRRTRRFRAAAWIVAWPLLALSLVPSPAPAAAASELQSHESIRATAAEYVRERHGSGEDLRIRAGELDPRLRLKACTRPLQAFSTGARTLAANASIGVRCPGGWKLFVPVRIEKPAEVLVSRHPLTRGSVLSADDLEPVETDTLRLSQGYFTRPEQLLGHRLRRSVPAGAVITHSLVDEQPLIERGERVMLTLRDQSIGVRAPAEALQNARKGERIRVRNLSSGRTIEGIAIGPKQVEVQ
ncbi:MAG: flagellar basal body P-ring formation chaperone FlgA [Wenzhouxiangellaceae bacterium]|nr:flagellar basal body P-ring formation chaperone FlgA [Wenzhouxiangellaceae bacterium]